MIMANAVISTGRIRLAPASSAAVSGGAPLDSRCRANDTIRILFAVATPMVMIAPVNAGTLRCVPVMNSIQAIPAKAAGNALMMMSGSTHDWKFTTISRYTSTIAIATPTPRPKNEVRMVCTWPRTTIWLPRGNVARA